MLLNSERLIIRPIQRDDAQAVFRYRSDHETNKYQSWFPKTIDEIYGLTGRQPNIPGTLIQLVIENKQNGLVVGDSGICFIDEYQIELGITLSKEFHNKGYATESIIALTDYFFSIGKHRIYASIDPRNHGSIRVFEKAGFRKEAHHIKSIFINGEWVDDVIYAQLSTEWKRIR